MATVQLLTQAEYAKHRGCSAVAVHKAVKSKRISMVDGTIDPVVADIQWAQNSRARAGSKAPAEAAPAKPADEQLPLAGTDAPAPGEGGEATKPVRDEAYAESRSRRERAEAEMAELKLQEQLGLVVNADAVRAEYSKHVSAVRDAILQVPGRLAPMFAAEIDVAKIQQLLDAELRQVLTLFGEGMG
jgi:hypothetical protein